MSKNKESDDRHLTEDIKFHYDQLIKDGPYATLAQHNRGGYKSQYIAAVFDEAIMPYFTNSTNENVLDLGCAAGILSNKLASFTRLTVGVDVSPSMLELARKTALANDKQAAYIQADGKRLPFKDRQFDSVITRETLVHIPDENLPEAIGEINRILRDGGLFYCLEQVSESLSWRIDRAPFTVRRSINEMIEITRNQGLECIEAYVVRKPRFLWVYLFWFRLLPKKLMRPLAKLEIIFNKHLLPLKTSRWHNVLFIFRKDDTYK